MRKFVVASAVLLPLLLGFSQAAPCLVDNGDRFIAFSSEESSTSSYLGVDISDITPERLGALKLKEEKGVEVTMVDQDAPAGKAGIKEHDVIVSMNGAAIESGAQLRRMIHETPPGRVVTFGLSRDGQPMTVKVQLADKQKEFGMSDHNMKNFHVQIPEIHIPDIDIPSFNMVVATHSARSGLTVENITPQLGEFFGVKDGNGVLVRSVEKGSRADKAGFHAGDVIVKVNDESVHDTGDFTHAVQSRNGANISVSVIRDKHEQTLSLSMPSRKDSGTLLEESFDGDSWADASSELALDTLQDYVAKVQPELALARQNARAATEEMRKDLCGQQKKLRQETQKLRTQARVQQQRLLRDQRKMRIELNQLRERFHWFDI